VSDMWTPENHQADMEKDALRSWLDHRFDYGDEYEYRGMTRREAENEGGTK
jgi:hypothetical protein